MNCHLALPVRCRRPSRRAAGIKPATPDMGSIDTAGDAGSRQYSESAAVHDGATPAVTAAAAIVARSRADCSGSVCAGAPAAIMARRRRALSGPEMNLSLQFAHP